MQFSEKIIQARKNKGMSQEALAEKIGVSRQAVSKWETGEAKPDLDKLVALCQELELSMDQLCLGREASPPPTPERKTDKNRLWVLLAAIASLVAGILLGVLLFGTLTDVDSSTTQPDPGNNLSDISVADASLDGKGGGALSVSLMLSREVPNMQLRLFVVENHAGGNWTELTALAADGVYQAEYRHTGHYNVDFVAVVTLGNERVNLPLFRVEGDGGSFSWESLWEK